MSFRAATGPRAASPLQRLRWGACRAAALATSGGVRWGARPGAWRGARRGAWLGARRGVWRRARRGAGVESAPRSAPGRKLAEEERAGEHARERGRSAPSLSGAPTLRPPPYALLCQRLWRTLGMPAASLFRRLRPGAVRTQWQERRSYFCRVHGR